MLKSFASSFGQWAAIATVTICGFLFFASHKKDVALAEVSLRLVKQVLGDKLGDKGNALFDIWIEGLDAIKNNSTDSTEEMIEAFVKAIETKFKASGQSISSDEDAIIRDAATTTVQMFALKGTPTTMAVKSLSLNNVKIVEKEQKYGTH